MSFQGCDLSAAQSGLTQDHFAKMSQTMSFCIIQNFIGNDGQSGTHDMFKGFAANAGLKQCDYNFAYPLPTDKNHPGRAPQDQALNHWRHTLNPICCLDCEWPTNDEWVKYGCSVNQIVDWYGVYQNTWFSLSGRYCILYVYPDYMSQLGFPASFGAWDLWIASYQNGAPLVPSPWTQDNVAIWQYSNAGALPNGCRVDLDCCSTLGIFEE